MNWVSVRRRIDAVIAGFRPVRFSAAILLLGFLLWTKADQSQDILAAAGKWTPWRWTKFASSTALWAWASWWFARYLSSFDLGVDRDDDPTNLRIAETVADWSPRFAGAGAFLVVAYALGDAAANLQKLDGAAHDTVLLSYAHTILISEWIAISGAAMIFVFTWKRRWITAKVRDSSTTSAVPHGLSRPQQRGRNTVLAIATLAAGFLFVAVSAWPVTVGHALGSENAYGLGFASILGGFSMLASFTDPLRIPLLRLLLVWSLAIGILLPDNHGIRTLPRQPTVGQKTLEATLGLWRRSQPTGLRPTLVLVATAGGGIRAAYWTAVVLAHLNRKLPEFHNQLFAISGVSGGSVGAALYAAMQADCGDTSQRPCAAADLFRSNDNILATDLLAPPIFTLLFPDLMQNFLPLPVDDRAVSLEEALEAAYKVWLGKDRFSSSFLAMADAHGWQPLLILNSTSVQTGERVVTSQLSLSGWSGAVDLLKEHPDVDFRVSTAANGSARFPIVEPPGRLAREAGADQIVDGGIYENFGATTLVDLLRGIRSTAKGEVPRIAVVQISSDPDLPEAATAPGKAAPPVTFFPDVSGPLLALLNSRSARGVDAASLLKNIVTDELGGDGCYVQFRMRRVAGSAAPPLGWVLSPRAQVDITLFWHDKGNTEQFSVLSSFLAGQSCSG